MATKVNTKVRLVRCPKCRQVLAELPGVQLYQCGGCRTILQAKNRNVETSGSASSSRETDYVPQSQQNSVSVESDNINGDCAELCEERSVSGGHSSSPEITSPENEDSPPIEVKESLENEKDPFAQKSKSFQSEVHRGESSRSRSFSNELSTSGELSLEGDVYNPEVNEHVEQLKDGESQREWQEGDKFEIQKSPERENEESVLPPKGMIEDSYVPPEYGETSQISSEIVKHVGVDSSSDIVYRENNVTSQSAEEQNNIDGTADLPIFRRSIPEQNTETGIDDFSVGPRSPLNGSLVSFYLTSPEEEHIHHSSREFTRNHRRVGSRDTLGSSPLTELNSRHGSVTNYPPIGSYYAYGGSESSYDGIDDQVHHRFSHPSRRNKNVDFPEQLGNDGLRGKNNFVSDPETNYWDAMRSDQWSESESSETNVYKSGNAMRHGKQEGFSISPFTSRDPFIADQTLSPSRYRHDSLPPRPHHHSSERPKWPEPDKTELLRTVCELKDQLNRMRLPEAAANRRFPDEKFAPFKYNHLAPPEREIYYRRGDSSRFAFSGEAPHYRHHLSCSCPHCCSHYSAQLPSHCRNGHYEVHTDHNPYTSSDEIKQMRLKEKYRKAKRCLRPTAGGAPLVACYLCWELLMLPADFLLFKKRYHRLKCNACGKILKFSLLEGTRLVPYLTEASAPPPSEAEGRGGATIVRNYQEPPPSHYGSSKKVDHVSSFDDFGRSLSGSFSTAPSIDRAVMDGKMSPDGSYEATGGEKRMKAVLRESQNTNESLMKSVESPRWRKGNSEIEEVGTSSNSPLHRLMGYSSPSQVLWRRD